jgi:hypothetical protein
MQRPFAHKVIVRSCHDVEFKTKPDFSIAGIYRNLMLSNFRNQRIADDVIEAYEKGRCPLILTERTQHLDVLYTTIRPFLVLCACFFNHIMPSAAPPQPKKSFHAEVQRPQRDLCRENLQRPPQAEAGLL